MDSRYREVAPAPWMTYANCVGVDPELFYPTQSMEALDAVRRAKAVCARCVVQGPCLEYALVHNEHHGVWGGKTVRERTAERRRRRKAKGLTDF